MRRAQAPLLACLLVSSALACSNVEPGIDSLQSPIINGRPATGDSEEWTVAVINAGIATGASGLCTGTVIGPYAVLTAKHCVYAETSAGRWEAVPAGDLLVFEGTDINTSSGVGMRHTSLEWRSTTGVYRDSDLNGGRDIAVIIVNEPFLGMEPRQISRSNPAPNTAAFLVGFGRNDSRSDDSGVKYVGDTRILEVGTRLIRAGATTSRESWTCQGDSGGPLLVGNTVVGVTSFGVGGCGSRSAHFFTNVAAHQAMLDEAIAFAPPCEPSDEVCDGIDNNCDDVIDEGCLGLGDACTRTRDCGGGVCEEVDGASICVRECDPASSIPTCPFGFHCAAVGCGVGACLSGGEGPRADGEECSADADCFSRRCVDVAGTMRCARQCNLETPDCAGDLVCEDLDGCASCIPPEASTRPRSFGNVCNMDAQCLSMDCTEGEGAADGFCTASCDADAPCPSGYHCRRDRCVAGDPREIGEDCEETSDCQTGLECVELDGESICAGTCDDSCPDSFECAATSAGDRCVLGGLPLGEPCADASECRSGICLGTCTRVCDDYPCPDHLQCLPAGPLSGCFPRDEEMPPVVPPTPGGGDGGCSIGYSSSTYSSSTSSSSTSSSSTRAAAMLLLFGWMAWRRRRS